MAEQGGISTVMRYSFTDNFILRAGMKNIADRSSAVRDGQLQVLSWTQEGPDP